MSERRFVTIVEDDSSTAPTLRAALEAAGHDVTVVRSMDTVLGRPLPDVLLVGGPRGVELLEELRSQGARLRAILTTNHAGMETCRRAFRAGAHEVLVQPIDVDQVVELVDTCELVPATTGRWRQAFTAGENTARRAARALNAWATGLGALPSTRCRVASAVAEAVDNAARHSDASRVELRAESGPHTLVVEVLDAGTGFDPVACGLDHMRSALDGGLARMSALAEDVQIDSHPAHGTRVTLRFSIQSARFEEEVDLDLSEHDFFTPEDARRTLTHLGEEQGAQPWHISPAMAVSLGRLLVGPDPRRVLRTALWS